MNICNTFKSLEYSRLNNETHPYKQYDVDENKPFKIMYSSQLDETSSVALDGKEKSSPTFTFEFSQPSDNSEVKPPSDI